MPRFNGEVATERTRLRAVASVGIIVTPAAVLFSITSERIDDHDDELKAEEREGEGEKKRAWRRDRKKGGKEREREREV